MLIFNLISFIFFVCFFYLSVTSAMPYNHIQVLFSNSLEKYELIQPIYNSSLEVSLEEQQEANRINIFLDDLNNQVLFTDFPQQNNANIINAANILSFMCL